MSDFATRLTLLIEKSGFKNASQFAQEVGINEGNLSSMTTGKRDLSMKNLKKILNKIDNLNIKWLLLGEGDIFFSNGKVKNQIENNNGVNVGQGNESTINYQQGNSNELLGRIALLEQEVKLLRESNDTLKKSNDKLLSIIQDKL